MDSQINYLFDGIFLSYDVQELVKRSDYTHHSLLHWAVEHGETELCRQLILLGSDINETDSLGTTSLMLASYNGHEDIVKLLLESGADTKLTNQYGADAVTMACANDNINIIKLLTYDYDDSCSKSSWPQHAIILSAACGSRNSIQYFYNLHPSTISLTNQISGMNALMLAEVGKFSQIKDDLVSWGAERNKNVKPFITQISIQTLITPSSISPLFSTNPHSPCSRCSPALQSSPVFLFPPDPASPYYLYGASSSLSPSSYHQSDMNHPLTPNICLSPINKTTSQKKNKPLSWLKKLKRKRSRSVENFTKVKRRKSRNIDHDNILDYILSTANLSEYKSNFINQEITFRTFLTLNEEELTEVGIKKPKVRKKFLQLIQHYKRIFFAQT